MGIWGWGAELLFVIYNRKRLPFILLNAPPVFVRLAVIAARLFPLLSDIPL